MPPPPNAFDGKLCGVMIRPHIDPTDIQCWIIHTLGRYLSLNGILKIMDLNLLRRSLRAPLGTSLFEVANQFLLLGIHRDDRIAKALKLLHLSVNVFKLGITIRVRSPLQGLAIPLEAVTQLVE